jgi:hypothetical protein
MDKYREIVLAEATKALPESQVRQMNDVLVEADKRLVTSVGKET